MLAAQNKHRFDQGDAFFGHDVAGFKSISDLGKVEGLDLKV
jgi:hypothetical protein